MKKYFTWCLVLIGVISITTSSFASTIPSPDAKIVPVEVLYQKIASMKIRDIQQKLGRKLSFKEKISFLLLKHQAKHPAKADNNKGQTALTFGIAGLVLFVVGLFVPFVLIGSLVAAILAVVTGSVAKRENPKDSKAHAGKLLGWLTLGLIALLFLLAAIVIASWASWI